MAITNVKSLVAKVILYVLTALLLLFYGTFFARRVPSVTLNVY